MKTASIETASCSPGGKRAKASVSFVFSFALVSALLAGGGDFVVALTSQVQQQTLALSIGSASTTQSSANRPISSR